MNEDSIKNAMIHAKRVLYNRLCECDDAMDDLAMINLHKDTEITLEYMFNLCFRRGLVKEVIISFN